MKGSDLPITKGHITAPKNKCERTPSAIIITSLPSSFSLFLLLPSFLLLLLLPLPFLLFCGQLSETHFPSPPSLIDLCRLQKKRNRKFQRLDILVLSKV
ncbi:hypothetical protein QN277_018874 [Acacia crassicarpa]|uniref:Transmembrane protein n=1 Tax=Acacia crassicarpa TaxID=499986 RepID=A0AAE1MT02_9FABA|nr:hypothetical protein QN277_018874 [Acacia crassicarpa]